MSDSRWDLDDALSAILDDTRCVEGTEVVDVASAPGRVLAEDMAAPINLPPFAASAMDGYALRSTDLHGPPPYHLKITGTVYAGRPLRGTAVAPAECVRIFTGAPVPDDLDAVVIQENCLAEGDTVHVNTEVSAGDNVRPVGHDVSAGTPILGSGRRLTEFDAGWLTACGISRVGVFERPTIGIFSTGDELVDVSARQTSTPAPGRIFDANRLTVSALLRRLPVRILDFGIVADDRDRIRDVLKEADATCQVVVTSGGVSVGEADWVRDVVKELGTVKMWQLNLKPGKPLAYGRLEHAAFFGLPGNPVSAIVTTLMLARPVIERLCGSQPQPPLTVPATLRGSLRHQPGREEFQRGTLRNHNGVLEVSVTGDQSSNRLASFAQANCLIRIPKRCADLDDGSQVNTLPLGGAL